MSRFMEIHGIVEVQDDVNEETLTNKFIDFVEKHNWYFGGGVFEVSENGEPIVNKNPHKKQLSISLSRDESDFLLDVLEEAMLLPYGNEEDQEMSEKLYMCAKKQLSD